MTAPDPTFTATAWLTTGATNVSTDGTLILVERAALLPGNATPMERAIAAVDERIDALDGALVRAVRDPVAAPAWALPYLAWERSVDVWDPTWSEERKRAVIIAAPEVHRYKGTRRAVRVAIASLGIDAAIVEWWETTPKGEPYTFAIYAEARSTDFPGPVLAEPRAIRILFAAIMGAKPESRAFDLRVVSRSRSALGLAPVAVPRGRVAREARSIRPVPPFRTGLGLAPVAVLRNRVSIEARAVLPA